MGVIKFNRDFATLFNWDTDDNPTTEQDYQNAVKNWTETEMNLVDALLWQPTTEYIEGNVVKTPSLPSQYMLKCTESGTSGSTEPSYSGASVGDTVTDGTAEWVIVSLATGAVADADASNIGVNAEIDNSEEWGSAIGGGAVAENDGRMVTGGTVHAVTSELASDIGTNAENIATNTENIATHTTAIANMETQIGDTAVAMGIDEKRISNIEKLLQGNLYDYSTDTDSKYTKTVLAGAMPYASLDSIGGKTVVMNQDLPITTSNWSVNRCTVSVADDVYELTCTANTYAFFGAYRSSSAVINGHKYLYFCEFKVEATNTPSTFEMYYGAGTESVTSLNTWLPYQKIYTATANGGTATNFSLRYSAVADVTVGDKVSARNAMKIDLTLWFGAGNEPATVEEFLSMYPSYIPYNAGTLLSAGVTEVVSRGKNLVDQDVILGAVSGATKSGDYWKVSTASLYSKYVYNNYNTNASPIFTQNNLTISFDIKLDSSESTGATLYYGFVLPDNTWSATSVAFTSSWQHVSKTYTNNENCKIGFSYSGSKSINIRNFQIEANTTATDYAPYRTPITTPIPAEIQSLEGYGWSAGSVYNYIDYERKVFVKNVGSVDLGTLTWTKYPSTYRIFTNGISTLVKSAEATNVANLTCSAFTTTYLNNIMDNHATGIAVGSTGSVSVGIGSNDDTALSNLIASLNGVMLYYELQTPIETDISEYLTDDNLIEVESGGTLTFPNSNGDDYRIDVPSSETYMVDLQASL